MTRPEYSRDAAAWINRNRVALWLSQKALAEAVGVTQSAVSKWERGVGGVMNSQSRDLLRRFFKRMRDEMEQQQMAAQGGKA